MIPHFEDASQTFRDNVRNNKKRIKLSDLKTPSEKKLDSIQFWWKRICDRYESDAEFRIRVDLLTGVATGFMIGVVIGACIYCVIIQSIKP